MSSSTITRRHALTGIGAMAACSAAPVPRAAAEKAFPTRPITVISPLSPGGSTDAVLRAATQIASEHLKQQVVVEFRPGGNTALGAVAVTKAKPDGYTLGYFAGSQLLLPLVRNVQYSPLEDFTFIVGQSSVPMGAVVRKDSPLKSFAELVAAAKERPGKISVGTAGVTTGGHLVIVEFERKLGVKFLHVPYKGAEYNAALLGGHIDVVIGAPAWVPLVEAGDLRLLAVFGPKRLDRLNTYPTATELGFPIIVENTLGIVGPKGIDANVVKVIHDAFKSVFGQREYDETLNRFTYTPWYKSSDEYAEWAKAEFATNREIAKFLPKME